LRTLLAVIFTVSVLLAIYVRFGGWPAGVAALLVLAVVAHLAGAVLGTRLRDQRGDESTRRRQTSGGANQLRKEDFAPASQLSSRRSLGWPMFACTISGGLLGMLGGMAFFAVILGESRRIELLLIGGLAFGVIGALASCAAYGFVQVTTTTLHQAVTHSKPNHPLPAQDRSDATPTHRVGESPSDIAHRPPQANDPAHRPNDIE